MASTEPAQRQRHRIELEDRLRAELERAEAELVDQVELTAAANEELASFAYAISHDLKAPLNTLGLLMSELRHELADAPPAVSELLAHGQSTARRAAMLIEDVLDYTQVICRPPTCEEVPLAAVAQATVDELAAEIDAGHVDVRLDVDPACTVLGNAPQVQLLVLHLVANAVKFRTGDRHHVVTATGRPTEHGTIRLVVEDNGIGMRADQLDRIFGMFERLHTREAFEGSGLGLTLCRRVAVNHGGTIEVSSRHGRGSRFEVELPGRVRR